MIYFDNSATTQMYAQVLDTYIKTSQRIFGNPSSLHGLGAQANRLLEQAREQIAGILNVQNSEIYFTSGGTEGNNWVLKGTVLEKKQFGNHIIISAIEHPAVAEAVNQLAKNGFDVSVAPVNKKGLVDVKEFAKLIRKETILVSIMAVNNEIGSCQPIQAICDCLENYPAVHLHVDAVQAINKVAKEKWLPSRVDFASFSAHKFHGPRGVGFIYWKHGRKLAPLLDGGGQESGQRSGTEDVASIASMAKALRLSQDKVENKPNYVSTMRNYLISALENFEHVNLFTQATSDFAPHIICFGIEGIRGEVLVHALEEKQIFTSTTSACSSKKKMDSSTLYAMGISSVRATSAIRISLDESNTMAEVEQFMIIFKQLYKKFASIRS